MLDESSLGDTPAVMIMGESSNTAGLVKSKFEEAETGRYQHEQRWLKAYKNFRGIYDSTTQFRDSEQSRVFIKITKTKVLAAYGQIIDVLFANKKFPLVVESTPVPEGIAEFAKKSFGYGKKFAPLIIDFGLGGVLGASIAYLSSTGPALSKPRLRAAGKGFVEGLKPEFGTQAARAQLTDISTKEEIGEDIRQQTIHNTIMKANPGLDLEGVNVMVQDIFSPDEVAEMLEDANPGLAKAILKSPERTTFLNMDDNSGRMNYQSNP